MKTSHIVNRLLAMILTVCVIASLAPAAIASDLPNAQELLIAEEYENSENDVNESTENGTDINEDAYAEYECRTDTNEESRAQGADSKILPDSIFDFSDVPADHWSHDFVLYAKDAEYMSGIGGNQFDPDGTLTKGEIVTILYSVAGGKELNINSLNSFEPYDDVTNEYFSIPVRWAYMCSLAQTIQTDVSHFSPYDPLTRVKIAELLWKFAQYKGIASSSAPSDALPYTDMESLTATQKNALRWCYHNRIMTGTSATTFSPELTVSRAQMAVICKAYDRFATKNRAFCVGTDFRGIDGQGIDTSEDAINARAKYLEMGYDVTASIVPTVALMRNSHYIRSQILLFSGHGCYDHVRFHHMQKPDQKYKTGVYWDDDLDSQVSGFNYVGISEKNRMFFVDLAVFASCRTAEESEESGYTNISKCACENGARVSIGWREEVHSASVSLWLRVFNAELARGSSISEAFDKANSGYYVDNRVKNNCVYCIDYDDIYNRDFLGCRDGDEPLLEKITSVEDDSKNLLKSYSGSTQLQGADIVRNVLRILQDIDNSFNIGDYSVRVYEHGDAGITVDFVRIIGGFETDSGYVAKICNGTLVSIFDNTKDVSKEAESRIWDLGKQIGITAQQDSMQNTTAIEQTEELSEALQLALERTQSSPQKEAANQYYRFYYDSKQDYARIVVFTSYYLDGTNSMGVDMYEYSLENCEVTPC